VAAAPQNFGIPTYTNVLFVTHTKFCKALQISGGCAEADTLLYYYRYNESTRRQVSTQCAACRLQSSFRSVQLPIYLLTVERRTVSRINAHGRIDYGPPDSIWGKPGT